MDRVEGPLRENPPGGRHPVGLVMIALTLAACAAALVFRTPLRSRYWAWQVLTASGVEQRAVPLTHLCNAGDAGRWGIETLLRHPDPAIRQYGVLVLQHVRSDRSRRRLLEMLQDPSETVRDMAALGLAVQADSGIIPELEQLYMEGDMRTASAACIALERLATPEAVTALGDLARRPAHPNRRAALVDALAGIGSADCAAALLELLGDHRPCDVPARDQRLLERLGPLATKSGVIELPPAEATSQPASQSAGRTVAERAAGVLARITGLNPPFASSLPKQRREQAARIWRDWLAARREAP